MALYPSEKDKQEKILTFGPYNDGSNDRTTNSNGGLYKSGNMVRLEASCEIKTPMTNFNADFFYSVMWTFPSNQVISPIRPKSLSSSERIFYPICAHVKRKNNNSYITYTTLGEIIFFPDNQIYITCRFEKSPQKGDFIYTVGDYLITL